MGTALEVRADVRMAQVLHFTRVFAPALRLSATAPCDRLEAALVVPNEFASYLADLHYKLLRQNPNALIMAGMAESSWLGHVARVVPELAAKELITEAERAELEGLGKLDSVESYSTISLNTRLALLLACCEWALENNQLVCDSVVHSVENKEYTADVLRAEPVGWDSLGRGLYHFSQEAEDAYLFRDTPAPPLKGKKARESEGVAGSWETVCTTPEELLAFGKALKKSKHRDDKAIGKYVVEDIAPMIEANASKRAREEKKQRELDAMPRKRSSRIASVQSAKEEEDRRRQEEEEERQEQIRLWKEQEKIRKAQEEVERRERARIAREEAREQAIQEQALRRAQLVEQRERDRQAQEQEALQRAEEMAQQERNRRERASKRLQAESEVDMELGVESAHSHQYGQEDQDIPGKCSPADKYMVSDVDEPEQLLSGRNTYVESNSQDLPRSAFANGTEGVHYNNESAMDMNAARSLYSTVQQHITPSDLSPNASDLLHQARQQVPVDAYIQKESNKSAFEGLQAPPTTLCIPSDATATSEDDGTPTLPTQHSNKMPLSDPNSMQRFITAPLVPQPSLQFWLDKKEGHLEGSHASGEQIDMDLDPTNSGSY
mmetsp:Transcript_20062/g.38197  ORF Transcript_20062/g.38197 Transcript_20062/m.38197 type:complete len:608 (-) Transcript_20062:1565-3388(-)|eukprot:CAMPEP_0114238688 /NCGR_PEP_ID=MMETSP0058-20121206/8053_1 /TAXON_ID=36894 /ORGANISM="Pyramimonas parkeae, CCMP726" /LENGTH=607 /DNA_ID=CAMNT_0001350805 /DNA_START=194 /DNA_END=2017 /DNA_ORIENTATION=-